MPRRKKVSVVVICVLLCSQVSLLLWNTPSAHAIGSFPDSFDEVRYLKYEINQTFEYYENPVPDYAGGIIEIHITNGSDHYHITSVYDVLIFNQDCEDPYHFEGSINYSIVKTSRLIVDVESNIGGMAPSGHHSNLLLGNAFEEGASSYFWMEDLMIFRGQLISNPFLQQQDTPIPVSGRSVISTHALNETNLIYPHTICGLGLGIFIEASVNHYYEKKSGLLLYSSGNYLEYLQTDDDVYQRHRIRRTLVDLDYVGMPTDRNGFTFPEFEVEQLETILAITALIGIVAGTVLILRKMRNDALKKQALLYAQTKARALDKEKKTENSETSGKKPQR